MTARRLRDEVRTWDNAHGSFAYDPHAHRVFQLPVPTRAALDALLAAGDRRLVDALAGADLLAAGRLEPLERMPRDRQKLQVTERQLPSGELRLRPGQFFTCTACGESCRTVDRGPLRAHERERLFTLPLEELGVDRAKVFYTKDGSDPATSDRLYLGPEGAPCGFLGADSLCRIHARFGSDAKPAMCRQFPWFFTGTPTGLSVGMRASECASAPFATTGRPAEDQRDEIAALVAGQLRHELVPPTLWVDEATLCAWETYATWETAFLADGATLDAIAPDRTGPAPEASAIVRSLAARARRDRAAISGDKVLEVLGDRVVDVFGEAAGLVGPGTPLDPAAVAMKRELVKQAVWNKQIFDAPTLVEGLAVLATRVLVADRSARSRAGSAADVVRGWHAAEAALDADALAEAGFRAASLGPWLRTCGL